MEAHSGLIKAGFGGVIKTAALYRGDISGATLRRWRCWEKLRMVTRHGYRSQKFLAATYVRNYIIYFTKSPKKLKKCVIFCNRNWLEVYYYKLPYNQGQ